MGMDILRNTDPRFRAVVALLMDERPELREDYEAGRVLFENDGFGGVRIVLVHTVDPGMN